MEMFLIRLLYLKEEKVSRSENYVELNYEKNLNNHSKSEEIQKSKEEDSVEIKKKTISQIKNFSQEQTSKPEIKIETKLKKIEIKNFEELIDLCNQKKEIKLKYELETNVSLVSFIDNRIEISFNENLDKNFVKELSFKLNEWTGQRWIIAFSKEIGQLSKKNKKKLDRLKMIEDAKKGNIYKKVIESIPDAELINIKLTDTE